MQPLHNFQFLPWHLLFQLVASSRYQEEDQDQQVESPPVSPPQSKATVADEPQQDFPKGRRRKMNSSSAANVTTSEPVKTPLRRLRLKYKEAETSEKKEKEEAVVVEKDYVAGFRELRPRRLAEDSQKIGQCSPIVAPKAPSINGFSLSLSAKEIEEDFLQMTGKMPPRNPKKRKMRVQKSIKHLDLGIELGSVCAAAYEVKEEPEKPEIPKKGRKRSL